LTIFLTTNDAIALQQQQLHRNHCEHRTYLAAKKSQETAALALPLNKVSRVGGYWHFRWKD